jgi:hypothetical protein
MEPGPDVQDSERSYCLEEEFHSSSQENLATSAAKKLKNEESLLVQMARYLYLPRLRDEQVLIGAIQNDVSSLAWQTDTFAYAEGWDEQKKRYLGQRVAQSIRIGVDDQTLLVKPDAAVAQLAAEAKSESSDPGSSATHDTKTGSMAPAASGSGSASPSTTGSDGKPAPTKKLARFHGSVGVDPIRLGRDAGRIAEEVVQHLTAVVGTNVEITIEIRANLADRASEKLVWDVTENCRTLKFTDFGFEEV